MGQDLWDQLSLGDKDSILARANVGFGIALNRSELWNVSFGKKLLELKASDFTPKYPSKTGTYFTEVFETLSEFKLRNFGVNKVSSNVGLSGTIEGVTGAAKASTSSSTETETSVHTKQTTYYLYAEYVVEKVTLSLGADVRFLASNFYEELRGLLHESNDSVQKLTNVYSMLNQWGWYVPTSLTLGGKLLQTETACTNITTAKSRIKREFSDDFEASVGVPKVFDAKGGRSSGNTSEQDSSRTSSESQGDKRRDVIGGNLDGLTAGGLKPWLKSMDDSKLWKVVGFDLLPVLSFVPTDLLNGMRKLQDGFGAYGAAQQIADPDAKKYFAEVELTGKGGLASDW